MAGTVTLVMDQSYYEGGWLIAAFSSEDEAKAFTETLVKGSVAELSGYKGYAISSEISAQEDYPCVYLKTLEVDDHVSR